MVDRRFHLRRNPFVAVIQNLFSEFRFKSVDVQPHHCSPTNGVLGDIVGKGGVTGIFDFDAVEN
jgi:hypothetical protein